MEPQTHDLKTWPEYFAALLDGRKRFEICVNDRNYQVGDRLVLREWEPESGYSGRALLAWVSYMTDYCQFPGNVVMGLCNVSRCDP